jgi:hypothetical protein
MRDRFSLIAAFASFSKVLEPPKNYILHFLYLPLQFVAVQAACKFLKRSLPFGEFKFSIHQVVFSFSDRLTISLLKPRPSHRA